MLSQFRSTLLRAPRFTAARTFKTSAASFLQVGDSIPSVGSLREGSPGNEVDLAELTKSVCAFSPACSASHVPGYVQNLKEFTNKNYNVFVSTVNDAFVTKAWADQLGEGSNVRFIADPEAEFAKAADLSIDATPFFGNIRNKRFVLIVEDGKVKEQIVEPDNFGLDITKAEEILKKI
ncbi:putative peroxiredoxin [Wickerhamomyces ciferrii]|uniref:Peroxiredoxin n=1 Tax=Wickerhamomyces ciferrii (strain ATCC 14091 / BCRC 22168 / CBS 111 / JCM 3599 / NBRC 0793 / NRRL Y-1031 F-60-10) TaxID=1206466 RepID=K0KQQ2_WICCF|nr:putative peroxiredoxin [Wickerhamomyces ciferrii]CCH43593.1 putative peroxiredoxin [Wickerhamomyces ciferrii]